MCLRFMIKICFNNPFFVLLENLNENKNQKKKVKSKIKIIRILIITEDDLKKSKSFYDYGLPPKWNPKAATAPVSVPCITLCTKFTVPSDRKKSYWPSLSNRSRAISVSNLAGLKCVSTDRTVWLTKQWRFISKKGPCV